MVTGMQGSRARSALEGSRFADLRWVAETESTNDDLLAVARDGAPEGIVLVADHQRAGRGRLDRTWQAPARQLVADVDTPASDAHAGRRPSGVDGGGLRGGRRLRRGRRRPSLGSSGRTISWSSPTTAGDRQARRDPRRVDRRGRSAPGRRRRHRGQRELAAPTCHPTSVGIAVALNHVVGHDVDREDLLVAFAPAARRLARPHSTTPTGANDSSIGIGSCA